MALGPKGAIGEILFLPDRYGALQGINGQTASFESRPAVRRTDSDEDTGFADGQAPQAVDHGQAMDGEIPANFGADLAHFCERHRLVGLIVEIKRLPAARIVAHDAIE